MLFRNNELNINNNISDMFKYYVRQLRKFQFLVLRNYFSELPNIFFVSLELGRLLSNAFEKII